jgi:hypothetical protein
MRHLRIITICLVALALHGKAWAQIYETKDAQGNTEFTDSPPSENAKEIDLQQTNIADAPAPAPEDVSQGQTQPDAAVGQQPSVDENNVVIERDGYDDGVYGDGAYVDGADERALRREDAVRRADPDAPHEVGDSEMDMPREVGDTAAQERREVGDSEAQMPHEVGDVPSAAREMRPR